MIGPAADTDVDWPELEQWMYTGQLRGLGCAWCACRFGPGEETREVAPDLWACTDLPACQRRWELRTDLLVRSIRQHLAATDCGEADR